MGGWLKRNAIALVAVVVLVPASLFVTFSSDWLSYWSQRASSPVTVERGADVGFGGAEWRVTEVQRIRSTELPADAGAPPGTDVVVVSVAVSPEGATAPSCLMDLEETRSGAPSRTWSPDTGTGVDLGFDLDVPLYCDSEQTGDYTLEAVFVVPADAGDQLRLNVEVVDELPRYLSLTL
ncbi:hypothetical protein NVV95_03380 [Herbiconiux sp. CPCC 205716]|uniref:Uncharacterized protein n=1 Tax=Herbiconiux gentiana TaxID=2970912 RepID=A0ABT2GBL4_9MICO|nr:hypothetical protein [Herbiconiux gentiana]MCS5713594.1 hypothetical protein [Herbiconiux gentiana]